MNNQLLETFKTKLTEAKAAYDAIAKEASKALFKDLFERNPTLMSFSWPQYSPYFNDGEDCVFSVHSDDPDINGVSLYDDDYEEQKEYDETLAIQVTEVLQALPEEVLQDAFGDHVKVTISCDKEPETEGYSHY